MIPKTAKIGLVTPPEREWEAFKRLGRIGYVNVRGGAVQWLCCISYSHVQCTHTRTYSALIHARTVHSYSHVQCTHTHTYSALIHTRTVHSYTHVQCTHTHTYSALIHTRTVHSYSHVQCTHTRTYSALIHKLGA